MIILLLPALAAAQPKDPFQGTQPEQLQRLYHSTKRYLEQEKIQLAERSRSGEATSTEIDSCLMTWLADSIWPFWMGTKWDFNGYSAKPREGTIACGYFVSTTLQHIGVNVNRYKLAQQYSLKIVKILVGESQTKTFDTAEKCVEFTAAQGDGIWVVGLSNHVGFLMKRNGKVWFVHSSYLGPVAVTQEVALQSEAFIYSTTFVVGRLSGNKVFTDRWLNGRFAVE